LVVSFFQGIDSLWKASQAMARNHRLAPARP